ncbi:LacI family DNA-binding transcriptional regulator [Paenibacillus yanchengensis]|uniref:LacI family DNA-binding transcriptional regulator n=1 Tax=Paenibacillus yanchengensis TaxID=2035833 RepID=A0ABW4YQN0_9BACL
MEDIARLAGVSKSAVSLALNGKPGVSSETRDTILRIANENGYAIKSKPIADDKFKSITFLVFTNSGIVLEQYDHQPFFRELIQYIEERCRNFGYSLLFKSIDVKHINSDLQQLLEVTGSEGIILLGTNLHESHIFQVHQLVRMPLVVLDTYIETLPLPFVQINNTMGADQAAQHLYQLGHTTIGYIESSTRVANFEERKSGFHRSWNKLGLSIAPQHTLSVIPTILSSQESLKAQLQALINSGEPLPTAFFCECDYIAISAIKTLNELGFQIPQDITVVGFDNIAEASIVTPELTTVHVEKKQMAYQAVDLILQEIDNTDQAKTKIKIDTSFIERRSSILLNTRTKAKIGGSSQFIK